MQKYIFVILMVFSLGPSTSACLTREAVTEIETGYTQEQVLARLGEPDRRQEFILPESPFFGPQEGLSEIVPAGSQIEEWVYVQGEEEFYIWFTGEDAQSKGQWKVIDTGRYPVGAVF